MTNQLIRTRDRSQPDDRRASQVSARLVC